MPPIASSPHILIADDDPQILSLLQNIFSEQGCQVTAVRGGHAARQALQDGNLDLLLTDLKMPDLDGFAVLEWARRQLPDLPVLVITSSKAVADAIQAIRAGALDYVQKPFQVDELLVTVQNALEVGRLRRESRLLAQELAKPFRFENIVGDDPRMVHVYSLIEDVALTTTTVLIEGESGTGKELIAQAIHYASPRNRHPLIKVNCVTLSESLLESELFGHEKGAFTGAISTKRGLFEVAHEGTLFLDEIGEMTPSTQAKLLQFLQDSTFRRVGGTKNLAVNVRVIAATNRDLKSMAREGKFREDLYYRLHVFPIFLPPLRDRRGDVPQLAQFFLRQFSREMAKPIKGFTPDALRLLERYPWPGNVRELQNAIERAAVLCKSAWLDENTLGFLTADLPGTTGEKAAELSPILPLDGQMDAYERKLLEDALFACGFNRSETARRLGINRTTLLAKMKKHRIVVDTPEPCEVQFTPVDS